MLTLSSAFLDSEPMNLLFDPILDIPLCASCQTILCTVAEKQPEAPVVVPQPVKPVPVRTSSRKLKCLVFIFALTNIALAAVIMLPVLKMEPWTNPEVALHLAKTQLFRVIDVHNDFPQVAFSAAVRDADLEVVSAMLEHRKGFSVEWRDDEAYMTPIHTAIDQTNLDLLKLLLPHARSANVRDGVGYPALHWAAYRPWIEGVELLLEYGANVNLNVPSSNQSALHFGAMSSFEVSKMLIDKGADVNAKMSNGMTPFLSALMKGQLQTAQLLKEHGADVNVVADDETNFMLAAAISGSVPTLEWVFQFPGADIKAKYPTGESVFHLAFYSGSANAAEWIIARGGLDLSRINNMTPVEFAVRNGWLSGLQLLIDNGADIRTDNARLQEIANQIEAHEIAELLATTGFVGSPLRL